jgi:hypothetical protein
MRGECERRREREGKDRDSLLEAHCGHVHGSSFDLGHAENGGGKRSARRQE